jgi:hypothetical protein
MSAKSIGGMNQRTDRKQRGRTAVDAVFKPSPTKPDIANMRRTQASRPITAAGNMGKHRGDRRDMSKTYTNNERHPARGNNGRPDVKTRKR